MREEGETKGKKKREPERQAASGSGKKKRKPESFLRRFLLECERQLNPQLLQKRRTREPEGPLGSGGLGADGAAL